MYVRPGPAVSKNSDIMYGKKPSSGLRFKHESIAFTNTTDATKIMWVAL